MSTRRLYRRIQNDLLKIVYDLLSSNATPREIDLAIGRYFEKLELSAELAAQLAVDSANIISSAKEQAEALYDWIDEYTEKPEKYKSARNVIANAHNQFAKSGDKIDKEIVSIVKLGIAEGVSRTELSSRLIHKLNKGKYEAEAIADTATAGYQRVAKLGFSIEAGVVQKKYSTNPAQRKFCQDEVRKSKSGTVYNVWEIGELNNGMGLNVLIYQGGWRCRHDWDDVIPDPGKIDRDAQKKALNYVKEQEIS